MVEEAGGRLLCLLELPGKSLDAPPTRVSLLSLP